MIVQAESIAGAIPSGSPTLRSAFIAITIVTALLFVGGVYWSSTRAGHGRDVVVRRTLLAAIATGAWIAVTGLLATRGVLSFSSPPTMPMLLAVMIVLSVLIVGSPLGADLAKRLSFAGLVLSQSFRLPLELTMHRAYNEGLMPIQMSYSGRNFDIITGITAILVGLWLASGERRNARGVVFAWNVLGSLLLINILVIALLSAPVPFRKFMNEPANVWILQAPWVWLPTVMVFAAILGHLLVFRKLRQH